MQMGGKLKQKWQAWQAARVARAAELSEAKQTQRAASNSGPRPGGDTRTRPAKIKRPKGEAVKKVQQALKKVTALRSWQLGLILLFCLFITATFFRFDHLRMNELKDVVFDADAAGDTAALTTALTELQNFVFTHTVWTATEENGQQGLTLGTGTFYLEESYLRAANAAIEAAEASASSSDNPNGNIYAAAASVCKPIAIANGWRWNNPGYLNCMTDQLAQYPSYDYIADIAADVPSTELYRYNYASPIWAPTWAGFLCIIDLLLILAILVRILVRIVLSVALIFLKRK